MSLNNFGENLTREIEETVKAVVTNIYQPAQIFKDLPEIAVVRDLAHFYNISSEVVIRMAQNGMPHTHAGREFRFHRSLLIEWTRNGEKPFPCETCSSKSQRSKIVISEETDPDDPPPVTNVKEFSSPGRRTRDEKLARLVRGE